jgi:dipeptidyl aminopeptidase/acylaminoacyl peptidase
MLRLACTGLVIAAAALSAPASQAESRIFEPMDLFALQWVDAPQISPDGKRIVYQRMGYDVMKDVHQSSLWMIDADGSHHRPLADAGRGAAWSPDGKRLAYVSKSDGSTQIQMHWMDTGQDASITELTESPGNLSWSPDGRWLAFTMRVPAEEAPLAAMPKAPKGASWAAPVKVIDRVIYRFDGGGYVDPGYTHVFVVASDGGAARQITEGKHNFNSQPVWTANGKALIVSANLNDDWEYQPLDSDLYRVGLEDGAMTRLTDRKGPDQSPSLSPDGKHLAWLGFDDKRHPYQASRLYVGDANAGNPRSLTDGFDYSIGAIAWDGDRGVWLQFDDHGRGRIGWIALSGGKVERVADDLGGTEIGRPYTSGDFSAAAGRVAYTSGTTESPADLAVVARSGKPRKLTHLTANLLDHMQLGKTTEISVKSSAGGREIQAWVVTPPGFDPAKKYPLLLEIHGGPFAAYGPWFSPEIQLYAAKGYVVVYANPRGSTSYGSEFANLIENAYPGQDYDDLMSVVDATIARGSIDTDNLFVTGGSGGGCLTAWIVGHTGRFRAAVSAKPVINWQSFVLTSDFYPYFTQYWFTGLPWENAENYIERSPIHYVGNVTTPTMMLVGDDDHRTPASEAEQFYQALKLRKIDTAMVRIPGASHEINARPSNLIAKVLNITAWFEKHRATKN